MKKLLFLIPLFLSVGCQNKPSSESEALLNEIRVAQSKIKVGINYLDYTKVAQNIQIKLDDFERNEESKEIEYAGNLVATAQSYINAAKKDSGKSWSPQFNWEKGGWNYEYLESCQAKKENCFGYDNQTDLLLLVSQRQLEKSNELVKSLETINK